MMMDDDAMDDGVYYLPHSVHNHSRAIDTQLLPLPSRQAIIVMLLL